MSAPRRRFAADQKATILKRYLVDKVPVSDLCDEYGIKTDQACVPKDIKVNGLLECQLTHQPSELGKFRPQRLCVEKCCSLQRILPEGFPLRLHLKLIYQLLGHQLQGVAGDQGLFGVQRLAHDGVAGHQLVDLPGQGVVLATNLPPIVACDGHRQKPRGPWRCDYRVGSRIGTSAGASLRFAPATQPGARVWSPFRERGR